MIIDTDERSRSVASKEALISLKTKSSERTWISINEEDDEEADLGCKVWNSSLVEIFTWNCCSFSSRQLSGTSGMSSSAKFISLQLFDELKQRKYLNKEETCLKI